MATALFVTDSTLKISLAKLEDFSDVWQILEEYFDAAQVVMRDDREGVRQSLQQGGSDFWLAYCNGSPAGCIALRPLVNQSFETRRSSEIKRLYVKPAYRREGIAAALLAALEAHASHQGVERLYLDSTEDMREAVAFYQRADYKPCARYNDNIQATLFMRKDLPSAVIVQDCLPGTKDKDAFWLLNEAWISKLFKLEPKDIQTLRNPEEYILSSGGRIYMACRGDERVGCCALLHMGNNSYELAKMGVAESERGRGVGRKLLEHVVADARRLKIRRLYLETNRKLTNAIHLYEAIGFRHLTTDEITPSPYARADVYMEMILN